MSTEKRILASDLDGTADSDAPVYQALFSALRAGGWEVVILTGRKGAETITPEIVGIKTDYLAQLGITAFDHLVVFPDMGGLPQEKAKWIEQHGVDVFIDNDRGNMQAASPYCLTLLPWATRMGSKNDGEVKKVLHLVEPEER